MNIYIYINVNCEPYRYGDELVRPIQWDPVRLVFFVCEWYREASKRESWFSSFSTLASSLFLPSDQIPPPSSYVRIDREFAFLRD